jgi:hypothetical protein
MFYIPTDFYSAIIKSINLAPSRHIPIGIFPVSH